MSETTRDLMWQERQHSQEARRQLAEALTRPSQSTALAAAREAAPPRLGGSTATTGTASAARVGLAQAASRPAGTSTADYRPLSAAVSPSISWLANTGLPSAHVDNLLRLQPSLMAGVAGDIGRSGARTRTDWLTKTFNDTIGVSALSKSLEEAVGASVGRDFVKGLAVNRLLLPAFPSMNLLVGSMVGPAFKQIHDTLNAWSRAFGSFDTIERALARIPLSAALRARRAALRGDVRAVRDFIAVWLERPPTEPVTQATIDALLEDDWVPYEGYLVEVEVIEHLRSRTTDRYTRRHKMLGATQVLGRAVESLDRLVAAPSGDLVPLVTLTPDPAGELAVDVSPSQERRAKRALAQFTPDEQRVLMSWEPGLTWQDAAAAAGLPPEVAERVRRKRKRVAAEDARRAAQRPA